MIKTRIDALIEEYYPRWVEIRRELHRHPELSFEEFKTKAFIEDFLKDYDLDYQEGLSGTALAVTLKGGEGGVTVALRTDMDALPIAEEGGRPYGSLNPGVMHACGHDAHMTMALGTLMVLYALRDSFEGQVKFLFQPAEESEGGADTMVKEGVLKNPGVDYVLGGHVWPELPVGTVGIKTGAVMSSPDVFDVVVQGKGGHVGKPYLTVDPVMVGAKIVTGLPSAVAKVLNPFEPVVISVTAFNSGDAYNITPETCRLKGTVRTYDNEMRSVIEEKMTSVIRGICESYGATFDFTYHRRFPPTINDEELTPRVMASAREALGSSRVVTVKYPSMSAEDFSYFAMAVPGTYMYIGTRNEARGIVHELHHPAFDIDEELLKVGVRVYAGAILDLLARG
ncbi:MAG: hypothetical protein AVO33_01370 [delta proteobacterium ML8_F1]|nr:MAG: hypothetical protein AVO33_01370 [delta proteobacterium ML8_F1]